MALRTESHDDLTKFGNRLWKLMDHKGYRAPKQLATALYDEGLIHINQRGTYDDENYKRQNAIGSIEKKIVDHIHSDDIQKLQGDYIFAYCKHFHCSADYLFGFTDIVTSDNNIRSACKTTGLSEQAISNLAEINEMYHAEEDTDSCHYLLCWSHLLESPLVRNLPLDWIKAYREIEQCFSCKAAIEATDNVLSNKEQNHAYYLIDMKKKTYEMADSGHEAAGFGMLAKMSQDLSLALRELLINQSEKDDIYKREYEEWVRQLEIEYAKMNNLPIPHEYDDGEFHFNKHILVI